MSERTVKIIKMIIALVLFIISIGLLVAGQRQIGPGGLGLMLLGIAGLIFLLWRYNRHYR